MLFCVRSKHTNSKCIENCKRVLSLDKKLLLGCSLSPNLDDLFSLGFSCCHFRIEKMFNHDIVFLSLK